MPRFTDIAKVAISVGIAQGGPIPPAPTASAPFGVAPQPSMSMGTSATAQGGAPTGLTAGNVGSMAPVGPLVRSDQAQPQPRMQTTQSLPETKAPGAAKAFAPAKPSAGSSTPTMPKPAAAPAVKKAWLYPLKVASVLSPAPRGLLTHVTEGLGMHPQMFGDGLTGKALGAVDAYGRASTLFSIPSMVADGASWLKDRVVSTPATDVVDSRKAAAFGYPSEPLPVGAMPAPNPLGSFMDVVEPLKHPIQSAKNFVSGLGAEADRQLTQSMIEQPVTMHQLMYQNHPKTTN